MSSAQKMEWLTRELENTNELTKKTLDDEGKQAVLYYIKPLIDLAQCQQLLIKPFFEMTANEKWAQYLKALPQFQEMPATDQLPLELMRGHVLIVMADSYYLIDLKMTTNDQPNSTSIEMTIHGSQMALSDNLATNINMIRSNYYTSNLFVEYLQLGEKNKQKLAIVYDQQLVNKQVLNTILQRLRAVDKQLVTSTAQLNNYVNNQRISLFPQMMITERPDRLVYNLAGGKVLLLLDGNPQAVVAPVVFFDFMTTMEDNYHTFFISLFLRILRYLGLFISLLLPSLYIGITSFAPEVFRTELALTIAGSRIGVPFSSFVEVLFMLFFMEMLLEASIRLPKAVSATATTVGGLILGTAVTEASLASNVMIIVVSAVAISTFVIPINEMAFTIRVVRLFFILTTTFFGLAGLTLSMFALIMYLVSMDSFGEPYLKLNLSRKIHAKSGGET